MSLSEYKRVAVYFIFIFYIDSISKEHDSTLKRDQDIFGSSICQTKTAYIYEKVWFKYNICCTKYFILSLKCYFLYCQACQMTSWSSKPKPL